MARGNSYGPIMASVDLTKFGKYVESKQKFFYFDEARRFKSNWTKKIYIGFETKSAQPQKKSSKHGDSHKFAEGVVTMVSFRIDPKLKQLTK